MIHGDIFSDMRGNVLFNNQLDLTAVKRMYFIENTEDEPVRAWQGHRVEQRWFTTVKGTFKIKVVKIDNWSCPSDTLIAEEFLLDEQSFNTLIVEPGHATSIYALKPGSRLMCCSDYAVGSVDDNIKFDSNKWK